MNITSPWVELATFENRPVLQRHVIYNHETDGAGKVKFICSNCDVRSGFSSSFHPLIMLMGSQSASLKVTD